MTAVVSDAELVAEAVGDVLRARCDREVVDAAEAAGWAPELWDVVAAGGFPWVSVPESAGGPAVGGTVAEACAVLEQVGRFAAPLPVAETGLLAGWLLAGAGLPVPAGPVTTAPTGPRPGRASRPAQADRPGATTGLDSTGDGAARRSGDRTGSGGTDRSAGAVGSGGADSGGAADSGGVGGSAASVVARRSGDGWVADGVVARVPWARTAERVVLLADSDGGLHVIAFDPGQARIEPGANLAGEPRDTVHLDGVPVEAAPAPDGVDHEALLRRGALSRAALIAGAAGRILDLTVAYTNERHQFGRPVARFQAVSAHLVRLAEQTESVRMAARAAAANASVDPLGEFDAAAAKTVASSAAGIVSAAAHQATGAMGMTREYELGMLTRRLWSWREEYGGERLWSTRLGAALAAGGADALWSSISRGTVA